MTKFIWLILTVLIFCGCTKQNRDNQTIKEEDYYTIVNDLISSTYNQVDAVITDLNKFSELNRNDLPLQFISNGDTSIIGDTIYGRGFFVDLYNERLIDTIDIDFMYNQIESKFTYKLDSSKINRQTLGINEIHKLFSNWNVDDGYDKLMKKHKILSYLVISEPLYSVDKQEILIDVEYFCGSKCGTGITYLFKMKNGLWTIIYKRENWIS